MRCYFVAPPPLPEPAEPPRPLLPAPVVLPVLPAPLLPVDGMGLVVLLLPELVPPAPAPARLSRRHFSRSVPVRPTQLLGTSVEAPLAAEPLVLGVLPVEPLAPPLMPTPGRSLAPVVLLPPEEPLEPEDESLAPAAPLLLPALEPDDAPPEPDPEPCAKVAVDRARSAAAVAAVRVFSIMMVSLLEVMVEK